MCLLYRRVKQPNAKGKSPLTLVNLSVIMPLGLFSLSLTTWWCALSTQYGQRFTKYAILGDDVVIADEAVAHACHC